MHEQNLQDALIYLNRFGQILNQMESQMLNPNITNNITLDFIECMIPHHEAAIYMCENLLQYYVYKPLQEVARNIVKTQTMGIKEMMEIAKTTRGYDNSLEEVRSYMNDYFNITRNMIYRMRNSNRSMNIGLNFVNEMIPHHEGAIAMCQNLLKYRIDPRLRSVANSIIREQSNGVRELKRIKDILSRQQ